MSKKTATLSYSRCIDLLQSKLIDKENTPSLKYKLLEVTISEDLSYPFILHLLYNKCAKKNDSEGENGQIQTNRISLSLL